jgi:predicted esterase
MRPKRIGCIAGCVVSGLSPVLLLAALPAYAEQPGDPSPVVAASAQITYTSSVDGAALDYVEYLPAGYNPAVAYPLVVLLHGAGGNAYQYDTPEWHAAADQHGYILATAHARTLPGYGASRLSFYMNGALVPAEQDVLDLIPIVQGRHVIDPNRIYVAGYSMGGVGALNLAALHPGVFAAAAPGAPMSDLFQQWDYAPAMPAPNFATLFGGVYSQTAVTQTLYYQNSPRFLAPNLMHTPIRVVHGISDTLIPNATHVWAYMQSRHMVDTPGFADSRGQAITVQQLQAAWPGTYAEEHVWPAATHGSGSVYWVPEEILDFFDAHPRNANPTTVAFTTYEDRHTRAYWLQLNLTQPWTAVPGLVYATRDSLQNFVQLRAAGSMTITLDMLPMGLTSATPLTLVIQPASGAGPAGDLAVVFSGAWPMETAYTVTKDGAALPPAAYTVQPTGFTLLRQITDMTHTYVIAPSTPFTPTTRVYLPLVLR